jgi:hypothetical protein
MQLTGQADFWRPTGCRRDEVGEGVMDGCFSSHGASFRGFLRNALPLAWLDSPRWRSCAASRAAIACGPQIFGGWGQARGQSRYGLPPRSPQVSPDAPAGPACYLAVRDHGRLAAQDRRPAVI